MGKIVMISGKSATGKDTIYRKLLSNKSYKMTKMTLYTTRPMRDGETEGEEYYFRDNTFLEKCLNENRVIEKREYTVLVNGIQTIWYYFTLNDSINLDLTSYLVIGTLKQLQSYQEYFGKENILPIYITVNDYDRLCRNIERESLNKKSNYLELCRRFIADEEDYSNDNLEKAGIEFCIENDNINSCVGKVLKYIKKNS